jgi:hypothetical protein
MSSLIERQSAEYLAGALGRPGQRWSGDVAEHIIVSPDEGAFFSVAEEYLISRGTLIRLCPFSPAVFAWHYNPETGRSELHIIAGSFTEDHPALLRVTELRRCNGTDYLMLLHETGEAVIREINLARLLEGRTLVRTLGDIRDAKRDAAVAFVAERVESADIFQPTVQDLLAIFRGGTVWIVIKSSKTSVSLKRPDDTTPLHIRWPELLAAVFYRLALDSREREAKKAKEQCLPPDSHKRPSGGADGGTHDEGPRSPSREI